MESEARRHPSERLQTWFRRVVDRSCGGEPGLIAIEDNIAVLVALNGERSTNESPGESDRFSTVIQAFGDGQFHILREHAAFLGDVKRALRRRKDEAYRYHMEGADREILEYPSAR